MTSFPSTQNSPIHTVINLELSTDSRPGPITVRDLREYVHMLDTFNVADDHEIEGDCDLYVILRPSTVDSIDCGNCFPLHPRSDILITTHTCPSHLASDSA